MRNIKVGKYELHEEDNVKLHNFEDEVDPMWGVSEVYITKEQLMEFMKGGKAIYFDDGEYAHLIYLKDDIKIKEKVEKPKPKTEFMIIKEEDL